MPALLCITTDQDVRAYLPHVDVPVIRFDSVEEARKGLLRAAPIRLGDGEPGEPLSLQRFVTAYGPDVAAEWVRPHSPAALHADWGPRVVITTDPSPAPAIYNGAARQGITRVLSLPDAWDTFSQLLHRPIPTGRTS